MKTHLGKIAQLPKSIRIQLNHRLENGQQSPELLQWLNNLPQTKKLIAKKFDNQPITKSNLSHWRHGGYQDWIDDRAREAHIQRISDSGASLEKVESGDLFENFARIAVAELMAGFDSLRKLSGEKRTQQLHNLIRDLARLQNSFNRSRWADLAWTKYNDQSATGVSPVRSEEPETENTESETKNSKPETRNLTPCPTTPVAPDCTQSQAGTSHDSPPKKPFDPFKRIRHTRCDCHEPCPQCHAPDSAYPLDEVLRDQQYYKKYLRHPYDRDGIHKMLINVECDCFCHRCAEKTVASALRADPPAEPREENSATTSNHQSLVYPTVSKIPQSPHSTIELADFTRRMALLKSAR